MAVDARRDRGALRLAVPTYAAAIAAAEACVAFVHVGAGVLLHAVLVLALLNHYLLARPRREEELAADAPRPVDALVVLPLVPLLRIASLTLAVDDVPDLYQYAVAGVPLLAAAVVAARVVPGAGVLGRLRSWSWTQAPIALSGIPLGYAAFLIAPTDPVTADATVANALVGGAVLVVFVGFAEEIVFRGVLHDGLRAVFGAGARVGSTFLFAAAYLGAGSIGYVAFVAVVGFVFAWLVDRTSSLLGVAFGHGLMAVGMLLVWPWTLR